MQVRASGHSVASALRTVATEAIAVVLGVVVYFGVRGLTAVQPERAREHARDILALERALGLDLEAGTQDLMLHLDWLVTAANWVYIWGHWPVIAVTLVYLALHDRTVFLRLRNGMIASGALGLCVYTTYPVAPPRLLGDGYVDTVTERSNAYRVLQPPGFTNQYAAMPSLHVGWDLLVGLAIFCVATTVVMRTVGLLMPVLMTAATVMTANHYVLDVLAGAALALVGWAIALWIERRRLARSGPDHTGPPPASPGPEPPRATPQVPAPRRAEGARRDDPARCRAAEAQ